MSVIQLLLQLILGQIPEALFFTIFMILVKEYKTKRVIFAILMALEYIFLFTMMPYSVWSHVLYFILSFLIMKILYNNKCNVTDIFTMCIASIILIIISIIALFIFKNTIFTLLFSRIITFSLLYIFRKKLKNIRNMYKTFWNKNKHKSLNIKSTTFRAMNLVIFNFSFFAINIGMLIANYIIE